MGRPRWQRANDGASNGDGEPSQLPSQEYKLSYRPVAARIGYKNGSQRVSLSYRSVTYLIANDVNNWLAQYLHRK